MAALIAAVTVLTTACTPSSSPRPGPASAPVGAAGPVEDLTAVSPALQRYRDQTVEGDLWMRPELSPRDRSLVTVSALITANQSAQLPHYLAKALDDGVTVAELSEIITHLAFYAGWPNAMSAATAAKDLFTARGIGADQLPAAQPELLALDEVAESARQNTNQQTYGAIAPGVLHFTTDVLFRDLWLRPDLSPRDRSLVTVSALVASGQVAQITYHLGRALDNGLTTAQAGETLTQLAFYVGWPKVFTALPVVKDVLENRPT
ncbi:carboxymuconolactone decarboxylase family protein [Mycolicibacterium madagascariense]|nr:carboxymuconolactone decarboxylase family protein [Mycolicibacterium madagascariense]